MAVATIGLRRSPLLVFREFTFGFLVFNQFRLILDTRPVSHQRKTTLARPAPRPLFDASGKAQDLNIRGYPQLAETFDGREDVIGF